MLAFASCGAVRWRRIESYRRRQSECVPRFDQSFSGVCEQQNIETSALQRRFLEGKAKRAAKKGGERQGQGRQQETTPPQPQLHPHAHHLTSNLHSSVHVQQKFLKRLAEPGGGAGPGAGPGGGGSPPGKLQRLSGNGAGGPPESLTKFSVEIVQQLEFTSAADSQPQQISTNVTVKALTNASVKSESGPPLLECKREPDNDFADLDQCAAALEKDAAANFPGFTDLIGDEAGDEIITSDAFKDLISEISDYPEFMKDFDFEDKCSDGLGSDDRLSSNDNRVKIEDGVQGTMKRSDSPGSMAGQGSNRGFGPREGAGGGYGGGELSPAAQTLKQMAEQHQHKQMGLGGRAVRSSYAELQDYLAGPGVGFRKQEQVKQEPTFPPSYKQYSPYGSPSPGSGSPGYLPRGPMGGPSPPRPPSGPPPQQSNNNLHINQAQHLHISHPSHGIQPANRKMNESRVPWVQGKVQVSAGQHMQLSGDLGGGHVSVAAHQGMYFGQQGNNSPHQHQTTGPVSSDTYTVSQSQTINFTQQTLRQRQQQAQAQATSPLGPVGSPQGGMSPAVNGSVQGLPGMGANMGMPSQSMMGMTREHHAKMLQQQQQQMLRAQQQAAGAHLRPPPPDYKATQGPGIGQPQSRFPQPNIRRAMNQPIPPSGPMMRAGGMVYGGARYGTASTPDWRQHLVMQQQQQHQQGQFVRHPNMTGFPHMHQGNFPMGGGGLQQQQQQQQQLQQQQQQQLLRSQQQQQQLLATHQHPHQLPPHLMAQQNQALSMQGQMQNVHMSQSQSISMHQNNGGLGNQGGIPTGQVPNGQHHQQQSTVGHFPSLHNAPVSVNSSAFPGQPADFNLDFLENMQPGDSNNFTQELLNSLDNDPGFNLQDNLSFSSII